MESYKKPIKAALSNLKKLARNKPKLKNAVSSITQSLDDLFKLTSTDSDSETSRVQGSITKAFSVYVIPLYEAHPRDALELAASLINAIYYTHISSYLTSETPGCERQLSWERVVDLGVLEGLSQYVRRRNSDRNLVGENLYLVLCPVVYSEESRNLRASFRGQICSFLTDSATNHKENKARLLDDKTLGPTRIGKLLAMTDDYPLLETLFELIFVLRPRASVPLPREAYLKKLLHSPFGVETFGPKATRQLYQIISDAKDSNMPQTFALLYQTLGAVSNRKPQGFHIGELRFIGRCIGLPEGQRVAYIDQTSIFIPFPSEPGDGTIGLMEVPLSTILELQVLRQKAEITLNLSEPPIVAGEMMQLPAESLPPYMAQFTIYKSDLPRMDMVIQSRSLTPRARDVVSTTIGQAVQRVATSVTPISVTHTIEAEKRGEEIRSLLGSHSSADDVNTLRSPLSPIPDGLKLQYQESSLGTTPYNCIAPRSLLESRDDIQASGTVDLLANPNHSDNRPNRRLSQLRPSKNLQVPISENHSSISPPTVENSSLASAGLNGVTRELLPTACNDEASPVPQRLVGQKWGAGQAGPKRAKVQEKTPQAEGFPFGSKADQVKDTISDTTLLIERQPSGRDVPRNELPTDPFGTGPYLSNLQVNRLAQEDITKPKDLDPFLKCRDFPGSPHPRPLAAGLPRARVRPHDVASPGLDDIVDPPFPLLDALPEQVTPLTTVPELTSLDDRIRHTTEMTRKLWSFDVKATLSSPKGLGAAGALSGTGEHCSSAAQADPRHVDLIVTNPRSLSSPQVILRTSDQHVPRTPSVITTSVKAPRKALLSPRKRHDPNLEAMESFPQLKDQPKQLDHSHQIPVSAAATERKRPGLTIAGQRPEPHSPQDDCEEILKVLGKIQTRVAEGLSRRFQGARQEVRTARDFVFQQARADLDYIRQQSISGQASLGNVVNDLAVQRRDLEQRYMFVMKGDISTAVDIKKIVRQHDCFVGSSSSSKPTSLFGGKGALLLKMGFAIPGMSMN